MTSLIESSEWNPLHLTKASLITLSQRSPEITETRPSRGMSAEITVVMAVHNAMPYLKEAVGSILDQTFGGFRFIIVNDGSTDGTKEYLDRVKDGRVQAIHQKRAGQGAARNIGFSLCETEFVAVMDADDISLPDRLETQLGHLRKNRDVGLVGSRIAYIGTDGRRGFSPPLPTKHEEIYQDLLRGRHALVNPTIMCRSALVKQIHGYRIAGSGEDWDFFLRMGEIAKLENLDSVHYLYRLHASSVSVTQLDLCRKRINHASFSARQRAKGSAEIPFKEFNLAQTRRNMVFQVSYLLDLWALSQYRKALGEILSSKSVRGYYRLAFSMMISPRWTFQRIVRMARGRLKA